MALPGIAAYLPSSGPTPVGSLIASAASPPAELAQDDRWMGGIRWAPAVCRNGVVEDFCTSEGISLGTSPTGDAPTMNLDIPIVLEAGYRASATGNAEIEADASQKAIDALVRNQSRLLELEFADGAKALSAGFNNQFLSNNAADKGNGGALPVKATDVATILTSGTSYKIRKAFGALESETMKALGGSRCMIHVPVYVVPYLVGFQIVERVGNLLLTKLGNIVVAGVGYTGSAPGTSTIDATQDSAWLYGTDIVTVWLQSKANVYSNKLSDSMSLATNKVEYRASKAAAVSVSRCVNLAVKADLASS